MSHLTQMAGLTVQNFVSAAVGHRRRRRADPRPARRRRPRRSATSGSTSRATTLRILLPLAIVGRARARRARASSRTSPASTDGDDRRGRDAGDLRRAGREPGGDQGARDERRRLLQRELGAPVREPDRLHEPRSRSSLLLLIPFALTYAFGRLVGDQRQGWALFAAMFVLWIGVGRPRDAASSSTATRLTLEAPSAHARRQHGGQGGPLRRRRRPALFAALDDGHVDRRGQRGARQLHAARRRGAARQHDARRGEPGRCRRRARTGCSIFALLAVFIAGLMVGRTPEYLGKKIQATEMKLVVALHPRRADARPRRLRVGLGRCSTARRRRS